ncbi:MAG TPA: hypothetical protein PLK37_06440, partial [Terricaulis sp.]|nr:hypothetical protein [Terricaulis sp.]
EALIDELTDLRAIVQGGAVRPQRPGGCTSAEHRQLDFWLGEWDVSPSVSSGVIVAESSITAHDQGCIVMEHWRPLRSGHGHSMNVYDAADGAWHQMWVDSNGRRTAFRGNFAEGIMRLDVTNAAAGAPRTRMSYRALDANTVRQWGEQFDPAANAWNTTWEFIYRRRAGTR